MEKEEIIELLSNTLRDVKEEIKETNDTGRGWETIIGIIDDAIIKAHETRFFSLKDVCRIYLEFRSDWTSEIFKKLELATAQTEEHFTDILEKYITNNTQNSTKTIEEMVKKIVSYDDVFEEFINYILAEKEFETNNPLVVSGYTAQKLFDEYKLNALGAYNYLIYLMEDNEAALADLKAKLPRK